MNLTKNEKKTLKLLLENAKISDSAIATKLKISSQAVGKIRKKLEATIIDSYSINLNFNKLGIKIFAIAHSKITPEGLDKGELEIEQKLLAEPHIIHVYRLPSGNSTHIVLYGFRDLNEMDNFFHSNEKRKNIHNYFETKEIFTFSDHSIIKSNPMSLFQKIIDELETEGSAPTINELERYKKKMSKENI